jgi:lysophospholipase L1-like esterase
MSITLCFFGDSLLAGIGDESHQGLVGHCLHHATLSSQKVQGYNLGVIGESVGHLASRWHEEFQRRTAHDDGKGRVIFAFGIDELLAHVQERKSLAPLPKESDYLEEQWRVRLLQGVESIWKVVRRNAYPQLWIGPPAVADSDLNDCLSKLDDIFQKLARKYRLRYISLYEATTKNAAYLAEVRFHDGLHPRSYGYHYLAQQIIASDHWWFHNCQNPER